MRALILLILLLCFGCCKNYYTMEQTQSASHNKACSDYVNKVIMRFAPKDYALVVAGVSPTNPSLDPEVEAFHCLLQCLGIISLHAAADATEKKVTVLDLEQSRVLIDTNQFDKIEKDVIAEIDQADKSWLDKFSLSWTGYLAKTAILAGLIFGVGFVMRTFFPKYFSLFVAFAAKFQIFRTERLAHIMEDLVKAYPQYFAPNVDAKALAKAHRERFDDSLRDLLGDKMSKKIAKLKKQKGIA